MPTNVAYPSKNKTIKFKKRVRKVKAMTTRKTPIIKTPMKKTPMKKTTKKISNIGRVNKVQTKSKKSCPNDVLPCSWIDSPYQEPDKVNVTWHTCITMNGIENRIIYITSQNVLIKSIESLQIPQFNVILLPDVGSMNCNIMIEDKFVGCFLNVCGEWYVMMRLFGKTLNTGFFARTEANKAYYKIKNIQIDSKAVKIGDAGAGRVVGTSSITIPKKYYREVTPSFRLMTSNSRVISLNPDCFENINKTNKVFKVLQRFRQQKLFANDVKNEVLYDAIHPDVVNPVNDTGMGNMDMGMGNIDMGNMDM